MALNKKFKDGARGKGLKLISDNGSQSISRAFAKEVVNLGVEQMLISYNDSIGSVETEWMMWTIKEEVL